MHIIGTKWVYKVKYKANGSDERLKTRLVAKGFAQQEEVNFSKTFSLVVKPTTVRIVLTIATSYKRKIHQLDVKMPFCKNVCMLVDVRVLFHKNSLIMFVVFTRHYMV